MVLPHAPFVPTPDSPEWSDPNLHYRGNTAFFKDMVAYTDKIVGQIVDHLESTGLLENTLLIFTGDNGTNRRINSRMVRGSIQGGKGKTDDTGVHVPLIVSWPGTIQPGQFYDGLIEFSDFFPTLAELSGQSTDTVGISFYPLLLGEEHVPRKTAFVHYDPQWSAQVNAYRGRFVRNERYKLYVDGRFYDLLDDVEEQKPLAAADLDENQAKIKSRLQAELNRHPAYDFRRKDTSSE
jgi:arylsulfatase A